jgi:hypothetical protein
LSNGELALSLSKAAAALCSGVEPCSLLKAHGLLPRHCTPYQWQKWVSGEEDSSFYKASPDDPVRPGWPKGTPDGLGGKFRPKDGDAGIGHNGGPPLEDTIKNRIASKAKSVAIKTAIRALARGGLIAAGIAAPEVLVAIGIGVELVDAVYPYVKAYFDPPQSLETLQNAANSPESGYDVHHIVEQATAAPDGSENELVNGSDNLARIPTVKHWELNKWYETKSPEYGDMTPREYLKDKSWEERKAIGLDGLRKIGVLK